MKIFGYLGLFWRHGLGKAKRWGNERAGRSHGMLRTAGEGGGMRGVSERSGGGGQGRHSAAVGGRLFPFS